MNKNENNHLRMSNTPTLIVMLISKKNSSFFNFPFFFSCKNFMKPYDSQPYFQVWANKEEMARSKQQKKPTYGHQKKTLITLFTQNNTPKIETI
jgi:hypothetical protein